MRFVRLRNPVELVSSRVPRISILMPVRDAVETIARAVDSIIAQTFSDWELVAVDDGSCDGTAEFLQSMAGRDVGIRVITTPPHGIASALQTGCSACGGDWIARMDADDVMHPERLAAQLEFAAGHPRVDVISCLVGHGGNAVGYAAHVAWLNSLVMPEEMSLRRFIEAPVAHPSVMFRKSLLEKHGGYRAGDFPEDYELWLRWLEAGVSFAKIPRELLTWNDPPGRLSRTDPRYSVGNFYQMKCGYLAGWLKTHVAREREIWLWGAGRITRRRFDTLEAHGIRIAGFVDVDPGKAGSHRDGRKVVMADDLPSRDEAFLVTGVGSRGAREKIHDALVRRGWREGVYFIHAA